jgi:hypothetical protein
MITSRRTSRGPVVEKHWSIQYARGYVDDDISSSSCSERIKFDSCSFYPQNKIGFSISCSVVLGVFLLLVYIVVLDEI